VKNYRVYFAQEGGRLELGESFVCASDEEALARARQARPPPGCVVELWEGGRLVARLPDAKP
jgi:hypothetical protein